MPQINQSTKAVRVEGGRWVERLAAEDADQRRQEFNEWIAQSPQHIEAFLFAKTVAELFKLGDPDRRIAFTELRPDSSVTALRDASPAPLGDDGRSTKHRRGLRSSLPGYLASVAARPAFRIFYLPGMVAVLCGIIWLCLGYVTGPTYITGLGEQRTIRLKDGSIVDLNTQTEIKIDFSTRARTIQLIRGEAAFRVAHESNRPFRVFSDAAIVQAVGTEFTVYRHDGITRIAVLAGRVKVSSAERASDTPSFAAGSVADPQSAQLLNSGDEINISFSGRLVKTSNPDVTEAAAWRQRRLSFDNKPLSAVVAEFRRYSDFTITLEGESLKQRRIRGVFHSDRPESLVEFLESDPSLKVDHLANGVIVRPK